MASYPRWRRRTFLVNRGFQLRFIGLLVLQMSIILAALGLVVYSHVDGVATIAMNSPVTDNQARMTLENQLIDNIHGFYVRSLILIGVTALLLVFFGLLASHKLAGPVVKIERYFGVLADGKHSQRIAFRRYDHLDGFADHANRAADALVERHAVSFELLSELSRRAEELSEATDRHQLLAEMDELASELKLAV